MYEAKGSLWNNSGLREKFVYVTNQIGILSVIVYASIFSLKIE